MSAHQTHSRTARATRSPLTPVISWALPLVYTISFGTVGAFAYLGTEVREPETTAADQHTLQLVTQDTHTWPLTIPEAASLIGTDPAIITVAAVIALMLARRRRWGDALFLALSVAGTLLLSVWTKNIIARVRPVMFFRVAASGYSFPSGHALNATGLALALGFLLWHTPWQRSVKVVGSVALALYACAVSFSRLILGVHYPTDVLGGCLLGISWVTLMIACYLTADRLSRRSRRAHP